MVDAFQVPFQKFDSPFVDLATIEAPPDGTTFRGRVEAALTTVCGEALVRATASCTQALEVSALALGVGLGDEIVVPSYTFPSTANAFALRGATIRFCDIDRDTLCIDHAHLATLVTPRTRAVVAVHYGGAPCDLDSILKIAHTVGAAVIEDCAHSFGARWQGRQTGTVGDIGTYSFHRTKPVSSGDGGAIVINNPRYGEGIDPILDKGVDVARYKRTEVPFYQWVSLGSSHAMSEIHAAVLVARLAHLDAIMARRRRLWTSYDKALFGWASQNGFRVPSLLAGCERSFDLFGLLASGPDTADRLMRHLSTRGVEAVSHYRPLHLSPMGLLLGGRAGMCPRAEEAAVSMVRLPLYNRLSDEDQGRVIDGVLSCRL